ncbi:MAG: DNA mismatch repair endonuclease MutL [Bacteroidales bacterium]|nr:DNA mismatch repair endonuclease MutL [Bacteroidales bacterium]
MADVIKLMSDALANQIAAGEVIQRPASVIKELVENSVDAGASKITVNIKDAGRTLVQVIDNGCGMSVTDARMSFERHATSKIYKTDDLFCIYTKGFRGEALASIAAVAEVELKTRRPEDTVGTHIIINGSEFVSQSACSMSPGTNFAVKSLFYNVPARRKFLKANSTELQHIITEFQRIVLTHPDIEFALYHNDAMIYSLPKASLKQRIIGVFGKSLNSELIPVDIDTSIVKITGFTGKPSNSKRKNDKQYFFVNNRFMKSQYFNKAVTLAYDKLTLPDCIPPYFLYMEVDPRTIDVNVHPTKTEINFENGPDVFRLLQAGIKETLSKCNVAPAIDFDNQEAGEIPYFPKSEPMPSEPQIQYDPFYNPFVSTEKSTSTMRGGGAGSYRSKYQSSENITDRHNLNNWEKLYDSPGDATGAYTASISSPKAEQTSMPMQDATQAESKLIQIKNKYIVSPAKSGLMIIDQHRAHFRVLYEQYLNSVDINSDTVQKLLYAQELELDPNSMAMAYDTRDELLSVGYELEFLDNGKVMLNGIPPYLEQNKAVDVLMCIIDSYKNEHGNISSSMRDVLAKSIARSEAIVSGRSLEPLEMRQLTDALFATSAPNYSPDGKTAVVIVSLDEIEKRFN